jgi:archaellum component FlaC
VTIKDQQSSLLDIKTKVTDLDKDIETMKAQVTESKLIAEGVSGFSKSIKNIEREIEDLWSGMDYISNPLK